MSYCRFSSDNWTSDVYVYEDVSGGWTTHVAASRRVFRGPRPASPLEALRSGAAGPEVMAAMERHSEWLESSSLEPIELLHAGKSFHDESPGECADRLLDLRALGYHVPQYALDELRAEQAENDEEEKMSCRLHDKDEPAPILTPFPPRPPERSSAVVVILTISVVMFAIGVYLLTHL